MAGRTLTVEIVGDTKKLEKSFDKAGKSASGFGSKLSGLAKGGAITAAVGGVALLGKGLFDSIGAAKESEKAQARLQSALGSAGVSFEKHGSAIQSVIDKTSKLAALDDEDLSDSFAKLVRTTGDVTKATEGMALAANIARARNISLEAATKTVEKGLMGNEAAFRKVGVAVTKGMTATQAFEQAQKQFAGSAEKYGSTAAGAQEKFGVAMENLQEKIGAKLLPILAKLAVKATEVIGWLEAHGEDISKGFDKAWQVIEPIFQNMLKIGQNLIDGVRGWVDIIKGIMEGDWSRVWTGVKTVVSNAIDNIKILLSGAPKLLGEAALALGKSLFDKTLSGLGDLPGAVVALVKKIPAALLAIGAAYFDVVTKVGAWVLDKYIDGVKALGGLVVSLVKAIPGALLAIGGAYFAIVKKVGGFLADAILDGLTGLAGRIKTAVTDAIAGVLGVINSVIDAVKSALSWLSKLPGTDNTVSDLPAPPGRIGGRASGGPVRAGTPYIVGERGPELFWPKRHGTIIPNRGSVAMAGGGGVVNNYFSFPNYVGDKSELMSVVLNETEKLRKRGVKV